MKKHFDLVIGGALVALAVFSLFTLLGVKNSLFRVQLVYLAMGFLFLFIFFRIGVRFFRLNNRFFYGVGVILLLISFFFGKEIRGSSRWLDFYFFNFQPSEFLKVFFIIAVSDFFAFDKTQRRESLHSFKKTAISFFIFLPSIFIVFKQPDLGSALVFFFIYIGILFFSGPPAKYFLYSLLFFIGLTPLVWHFLADYQKNRIISFLTPSLDPAGISYNLIQSIITVGSGGFFGRGLGRGTQSRFLFLPENTTDFAFASSVEQFGFIGGLTIICLYGIIAYRLLQKIFRCAPRGFNFLFLIGVLTFISVQVFINIGMNVGLVPVAGIPLPLISYGGSSIVSTMMLFGLVMSLP